MTKTRKGSEHKAIELCESGDFVNAIAELVAAREHVTFVEMERFLSPYMDTQGDVCIGVKYQTVLLWVGMSDAFAKIYSDCTSQNLIFRHPASAMTYMVDGGMLDFPLVKTDREYKKPHWFPVCFCSYPWVES